jgi:hypothetical protein
MTTAAEARSIKDLFREWRGGDRDAGAAMAQRFADWYYAIATARLGESKGDQPCKVACQRFTQGVAEVKEARNLVAWAHDLIREELDRAGHRATDGDEPNPYTANQKPKQLLARCAIALPAEVGLLAATYGGKASRDEIERMAAPFGGNPLGVLRARYRVKAWLRDQHGVPFHVAPEHPVLDRAPLPLYESGRMATAAEEANFEQWMISDFDLCRDIAEFAHFAIAMRGGLPAAPDPTPPPQPPRVPAPPPMAENAVSTPQRRIPVVVAMGALLAVLAIAMMVVLVVLSVVLT